MTAARLASGSQVPCWTEKIGLFLSELFDVLSFRLANRLADDDGAGQDQPVLLSVVRGAAKLFCFVSRALGACHAGGRRQGPLRQMGAVISVINASSREAGKLMAGYHGPCSKKDIAESGEALEKDRNKTRKIVI